MRTNIVRLALLFIAGFLFAPFNDAQAVTNSYRLMLRNDPATSVVIGWNQASGSDAVVYYGPVDKGTAWSSYPSSKTVDRGVTYKGMNNRFARLSGLQPNTAYYFVVRDADGTSQRYWFKTLPNDPTQRLSIIAGGDSRNNRTPRQNANKLVAKLRPHVVMFGGDMTESGTDSQWAEWFVDWQLTVASDGRMFPVLATRGNHEGSNSDIYNLFDVPSSSVYYAVNLGGSLVRAYTLNTETSIAGTQTSWLSSDLAANSNVTWKIAQYHRPMRPHASYKTDGVDQYNNWAPLFQQHNVKLVVESDAHTVKTTWPLVPSSGSGSDEGFIRDDANGTVYVGEGCWGAPLRQADDAKAWTRNSGMFNHFNWIFVDQSKIEVRTVNVDNAPTVGTLTDASIFSMPSGINIWTPTNGALITINNTGSSTPTPTPSPTPTTGTSVTAKISAGANDVEESQSGTIYTNSSDIELVNDGATYGNQTVGLRFTGVGIPRGATVTNAYIQFTTKEIGSTATNMTIKAENVDNSAAFTTASFNVSSRVKTTAAATWAPASWSTAAQAGTAQRTADLKALVQQVVNRTGWNTGNAMSFIMTGTGKRTAYSYEGSAGSAPTLVVQYTTGTTTAPAQTMSINTRISSGANDVEQLQSGAQYTNSSDIELVNDGTTNGNQTIGLRFTGVAIPKGATVTKAYVQFVAKESGSTAASLVIKGENADNSAAFTSATNNISLRPKTLASVSWAPAGWTAEGAGTAQRSPELKTIVQQVVNRTGWVQGNAITLIITGTGKRTAYAYEGSSTKAPQLVIEYTMAPNGRVIGEEEVAETTAAPEIEVVAALPPEMSAYPNPFSDAVNLKIQANRPPEELLKIEVYDISGRLVMRKEAEWVKDKAIELKTHQLSAGQYIIVTEYNKERLVQKVVKY